MLTNAFLLCLSLKKDHTSPRFFVVGIDQELIRKDKRKEASEANSAWEVAKLAVFKQPA